jgi:membrane protein implicated in regulation of membrane protease activity
MAAGALAAHLGLALPAQLVAAALVGGSAIIGWQRWRKRHLNTPSARANRDVNLDIGQTLMVSAWEADGTARVRYRGADWTAQLQNTHQSTHLSHEAKVFQIVAVEGSRLIVKPVQP